MDTQKKNLYNVIIILMGCFLEMQVVQKLRKCQWLGKQGWWIQFTILSDQGFQQAPTTNETCRLLCS